MTNGQEPQPSGDPFRLGSWSVDPSSGTVTRGQADVRPEPKVMEVLLQLAGRFKALLAGMALPLGDDQ